MASFFQRFLSWFFRAKSQSDPIDEEKNAPTQSPRPAPIRSIGEPTAAEWEEAKSTLHKAARPASFGELGGFRPANTDDRFTSWWGGNFLAVPGEKVPTCDKSKAEMLPIFQLRVDELTNIPKAFEGIALLTLWFDVGTEYLGETRSGAGFVIRTYPSLDGLVPLGIGYREHETMPTFPIKWHHLENDLPDWGEFHDKVPDAVACSQDSDWFFGHPALATREKLQSTMPIKIGGYSQWWQEPQDVPSGDFAFFLDTTSRGNFGFPAGGNANFFKVGDTWEMRVDFT